jgi:CheY-like chemotaxis protein
MTLVATRSSRALEKREILVVEPDDDRRARLSWSIRRAGARVTTAADGYEATSLACLGVYEVVVISLRLPDMTGAELVRSVKGLSPWTQVVHLAADWLEVDESAETEGGGEGPLEPVAEGGIVMAIRNALTLAGMKRE